MKKVLLATLACIAGMMPVAAKEITFLQGDKPLNGELVFPDVDIDTDIPGVTYITIDPNLWIESDIAAPVTINLTANVPTQLCGGYPPNDQCTTGLNVTKNNVELIAGTPMNLRVEYINEIEGDEYEIPEIEVLLEAWYEDEPENKTSLLVYMGMAGVESVSGSLDSVKVNGNVLSYDMSKSSQIDVYSISGKTVASKTVSGAGTMSLANLPKGIYVYRAAGKTGKFIIR